MEQLESINKYIKRFINKSESKQGYINIEFWNGIHLNSYGMITYRWQMSGSPDGYIEFKSLDSALNSIKELS